MVAPFKNLLSNSVLLVDLDNTLAESSWRSQYAQAGDWDQFHSMGANDKVNHPVETIVRLFSNDGYKVFLLTGRNERYRLMTRQWLDKKDLSWCVDELLMRPDDDFTPDVQMKKRLLEEAFGSIEAAADRIIFALDDRDKVCAGFREVGITTHQVRAGEY